MSLGKKIFGGIKAFKSTQEYRGSHMLRAA